MYMGRVLPVAGANPTMHRVAVGRATLFCSAIECMMERTGCHRRNALE
jgi:hypothetical protein